MMEDPEEFIERMKALGAPPPPPGYGVGVDPPEWFLPDTFTGRRYQLYRLRTVLWLHTQKRLRIDSQTTD